MMNPTTTASDLTSDLGRLLASGEVQGWMDGDPDRRAFVVDSFRIHLGKLAVGDNEQIRSTRPVAEIDPTSVEKLVMLTEADRGITTVQFERDMP